MGMCTGLRFKGIIKKEFRDDIKILMDVKYWSNCNNSKLKEFSKENRSNFIPFGALSYMPDCWEEEPCNEKEPWNCPATDGFELQFNEETGYWAFQCSLKTYSDTIGIFINDVVPLICEKVIHCEEYYEEDSVSDIYILNEKGKIEKSNTKIRYNDYGFDNYDNDSYIIDYDNYIFLNERMM